MGSRWSRDASPLIGCAEVSATPAQTIAARRVYDIGRVDGYDYLLRHFHCPLHIPEKDTSFTGILYMPTDLLDA